MIPYHVFTGFVHERSLALYIRHKDYPKARRTMVAICYAYPMNTRN